MTARASARPGGRRTNRPLSTQSGAGYLLLVRTLQQTAVLALAVFGFLFCLVSVYQLDVVTARAAFSAAAFVLLFSVVCSFKRRGLFLILTLAAGLLWALFHASDLLQGLLLLVDQALGNVALRLPDALQALLVSHTAEEALLLSTTALQALLFFVSLLCANFIVCLPSVFGLAIATLPLLVPASFYQLSPAVLPAFCLFAAHLLLLVYTTFLRMPPAVRLTGERSTLYIPRASLTPQQPVRHVLSLFSLVVVALAAALASVVLPQAGYQRPEAIESLQQTIFSLSIGKGSLFQSNDGLTHGNLRDLSSIRFTGNAAIKISLSEQLSLYLRDFAGTLYTNDGWQDVSSASYQNFSAGFQDLAPQNFLALATLAGGETYEPYTLSVKNVAASATAIWMPDGLATAAGEIVGARYVQDTALEFASSANDGYTVSALPCTASLPVIPSLGSSNADGMQSAYLATAGSSLGLADAEGADAEKLRSAADAYIPYVFSAYTALPDDTRASANALLAEYGLSLQADGDTFDLYDTVLAVHDLLTSRCSYAYSPPEVPANEDFVTYFLETSRQGYCVHFATSAAVLLRALGVPARYAEGYIVVPSDFEKQPDADGYIPIEDTHAHAWLEVFDPTRLEWIPVEVTASTDNADDTSSAALDPAGQNDSSDAQDATPTAEPTEEPTPEPTPEPTAEPTPEETDSGEGDEAQGTESPDANATPDAEGAQATESAAPGETPLPDESASPDAQGEGDGEGEGTAETQAGARPPLWPVFAILAAAGLPLAAFGLRRMRLERLKRQLFQKNPNSSALAVCKYALDLLRFAGCEPFSSLDTPDGYALAAQQRFPWIDGIGLETLLEIAQRARFSNHISARQERDFALAWSRAFRAALAPRLKRVRGWLFCWRFPKV